MKKHDLFYNVKKFIARLLVSPFVYNKKKRKYYVSSLVHSFWRTIFMNLCYRSKKETDNFKFRLVFVCIIKNEALYMKEWIDFHHLLGVEHFFVYDNGSTDNIKEILKPYIENGLVTYIYYPGMYMQHRAYNDAVKKYKNDTKWMAFIDPDEFVVPLKNKTILGFLYDYDEYSQILIYWLMYGSSHHKKRPEGLVIENFKYHAQKPTFLTKAIVNPRRVIYADVHYHFVVGKTTDENFNVQYVSDASLASINKIRINHYFLKSFEEFSIKHAKGRTDNTSFGDLKECFKKYDINDEKDDIMERFVPFLKK